jgi:hypothetical protein
VATDAEAQATELDDDHACLTFGEPGELPDLTAAFASDVVAASPPWTDPQACGWLAASEP